MVHGRCLSITLSVPASNALGLKPLGWVVTFSATSAFSSLRRAPNTGDRGRYAYYKVDGPGLGGKVAAWSKHITLGESLHRQYGPAFPWPSTAVSPPFPNLPLPFHCLQVRQAGGFHRDRVVLRPLQADSHPGQLRLCHARRALPGATVTDTACRHSQHQFRRIIPCGHVWPGGVRGLSERERRGGRRRVVPRELLVELVPLLPYKPSLAGRPATFAPLTHTPS